VAISAAPAGGLFAAAAAKEDQLGEKTEGGRQKLMMDVVSWCHYDP
jgi:hypothetical protein